MSTTPGGNLSEALFGKTRRAVLALLYCHPDERFYLRQIARLAGVGLGAVQREVQRLFEAGILRRFVQGRQVYYQVDSESPIFGELKSLMIKTAGVAEVLRAALAPLAQRICVAFVYGSVARGQQRRQSDVDVFLVGDVTFAEVVAALRPCQETLGREVNPTVYPIAEFREKSAAGQHFMQRVFKEPRVLLIGDERELARMAEKRLAGGTSNQRAGNC